VKLNFSKSGVSTSLGGTGATLNVKSGRKSCATVGLPGTGIGYSENVDLAQKSATRLWAWLAVVIALAIAYKIFL
jgi:hypothetical protein